MIRTFKKQANGYLGHQQRDTSDRMLVGSGSGLCICTEMLNVDYHTKTIHQIIFFRSKVKAGLWGRLSYAFRDKVRLKRF